MLTEFMLECFVLPLFFFLFFLIKLTIFSPPPTVCESKNGTSCEECLKNVTVGPDWKD